MKRSIYRTLFIWAVLVVAFINIYPTLGWLIVLDEPAREARLAKWKAEDDERAKSRQTSWQKSVNSAKRWLEFDRDRVINLGLDLQGGIHMVLGFDINKLTPEALKDFREEMQMSDEQITKEVQDIVLSQIRRRVADFEADEPIIQSLGANKVQVQLPGEKDIERARALMTKVAQLRFHVVADPATSSTLIQKIVTAMPNELEPFLIRPSANSAYQFTVDNFERVRDAFAKAAEKKLIPDDKIILLSERPKPFQEQRQAVYVLDKTPLATGDGLRSAAATPDRMNPPYWSIQFAFNADAGGKFGTATQANINKPMAIVVDDVVLSAPVIRDRISTNGQITGNFEGEEARDLAIALNSGSMPVKVTEEFTRVVGASLGADAVQAGYTSATVALVCVGAFLCVYYLGGGLVAAVVLALNSLLVIAAMAYFGLTLTMPGIAGLILTIAVAVDGNILIYERIREELRQGHSLLTSIDAGFERAGITILDANVTNLIVAAILFQFGTGPIEGFSIALAIGICVGVFNSLIVTRALLDFMVDRKFITKFKMFVLIPDGTKINFMNKWKICITASAVVIVAGFGVFFMREMNPEATNFGVDFTPGTNVRVNLTAEGRVPVNSVREALNNANFKSPIVQESAESDIATSNEFVIRVGEVSEDQSDANAPVLTVGQRIQEALAPLTTGKVATDVSLDDLQTVGPAIGNQLRIDAIKALFFALVFVMIFLWWRFDWRFAGGAVTAVFHDVLITVAILAMLAEPITMNVVAGLLTIIGYSLNDTIVVFDRVREDLRLYRGKGYSFIQILDIALNVTLSRTLLTSLITVFVLVSLLIFGGDAIRDFALTLVIGMIVGTYSSIYIASPVTHLLREWRKPTGGDDEIVVENAARRKRARKRRDEEAEAVV